MLPATRSELSALLDSWEVVDWGKDPFARGGYAVVPVGQLTACAQLAQPIAHTLFGAGEATNPSGFAGTVEGAFESGRRAAESLLRAVQ